MRTYLGVALETQSSFQLSFLHLITSSHQEPGPKGNKRASHSFQIQLSLHLELCHTKGIDYLLSNLTGVLLE